MIEKGLCDKGLYGQSDRKDDALPAFSVETIEGTLGVSHTCDDRRTKGSRHGTDLGCLGDVEGYRRRGRGGRIDAELFANSPWQ
jgi:hypothetical protein